MQTEVFFVEAAAVLRGDTLQALNEALESNKYLTGEFSVADVAVGSALIYASMVLAEKV